MSDEKDTHDQKDLSAEAFVALLPALVARDTKAKGAFVRAVIKQVGGMDADEYSKKNLEQDWESAKLRECERALVWLWRADYWASSSSDDSQLDTAIEDGLAERIVRRYLVIVDELAAKKERVLSYGGGPKVCPACGSEKGVIPVLMGEPMPDAFELADLGHAVLGGCCLFPETPLRHCRACGHDFYTIAESEERESNA